nr:AMP-binding protein [Ktedonobacterales bacterium]
MHLGELVASTAARTPDKPALIFRDQVTTYAQLDQRVNQVANGLTAMGVKKGDRVGLYLHNVPLFIESYYGIQRIGATVVPLNPLYKPAEIAFILNDCGAKAVITLGMFYPNVAAARQEIRSLQHAITDSTDPMAGAVPAKQAFDTAAATPLSTDIGPDDVAVICYTSGTTGKPKGAMLTHRNFVSNCTQMNSAQRVGLTSDDVVWVGLPLFHIYAMNVAMNLAVMVGATMVLMERFDPAGAMDLIARHHVTAVHGAPPMYIAWSNLPNVRETYDLSMLRYCGSGAAALPVQVLENFKNATGVDITEGYGLTEAAPVVTTNAAGPVSKPGSIGPAVA